jgi:hypothetical protein
MSVSSAKPVLSDTLSVLLPTPAQTLLLRACLWKDGSGREASGAWLQQHSRQPGKQLQEDHLKSLLPLLFAAFQRNGVEADHEFLTILRAASLREELRAQTYRRICREVLSAFAAAGISSIVLKGAALADLVYAHPALRHCHDLDLLLEESDPAKAIRLLSSLGFSLIERALPLSEWQDLQFVHESGLPLELHRYLFRLPLYNTIAPEIQARSHVHHVADVPVRILTLADQLLHVCGHAASCASRESLRWACDAWLLVERFPDLDWGLLEDCARRSHLTLPLSVLLNYLATELRAPIPAAFLTRLTALAARARMVECEAALWGAHASGRGRFKNLLRMTNKWRARIFVLRWILFPSPTYVRTMRYVRSPWHLPFYYLSRPLRYVAQRGSE